MHYEDLTIKEIRKSNDYWYVILSSPNGDFQWPVAHPDLDEEKLYQNGIYVGKNFLGVVENDKLIGLQDFSFININIIKK